ncbi:GH39 family glycosyl hydrolase [Candidatus Enterococcus murrayae]|uniref:Helix-turn-helix domain-containing protein n=1 Tax=Candidatus Enterococcus murrayae TaxID=2815321 RepID=A0ABS3HEC9_9ENTE|nr:helix-turn-helix domain-containing protein [Enterococcus sp. MJM16]MBO0451804.1 helix-turn-helix domain-containing protein [Enterococcus sp. MJM16]
MRLIEPWENIEITVLTENRVMQHFDTNIHLVYVLAGEVTIEREDTVISLQKNDFYLLTKSLVHTVYAENTRAFEIVLDYYFEEKEGLIFEGNSVTDSKSSDYQLIQSIERLLKLYILQEKHTISEVFEEYFHILKLLEKGYTKTASLAEERSMKQKVYELKFFIDNNFDKDIRLVDIANKLYVSDQYLSRSFSNEIGMPMNEYLIRKRLEKVRKDLLETEKSITDIAFSAGFSNINSFNRLFKKYQGLTPSEFRKEIKAEAKIVTKATSLAEEDIKSLEVYFKEKDAKIDDETIQVSMKEASPQNFQKNMINLGYAGDLTHASFAEQIHYLQQNNPFMYGRIWGLLSEEILEQVGEVYDFSTVDEILQIMVKAGIKPFLELGFKGKLIHESHTQIIKSHLFIRKSYELSDLIQRFQAFFHHCVDVFGLEEVKTWIIELWKPNQLVLKTIGCEELTWIDDHGKRLNLAKEKTYIEVFSMIKAAVQQIVPEIQIGGCGLSLDIETRDLGAFLSQWTKGKGAPDFISLSIYPMDAVKQQMHQQKSHHEPISPDSNYMLHRMKEFKKLLSEIDYLGKTYISEFNVTILNRDIINDTAFKGSYILKNVLAVIPYCDLIGYWQLTDLSVTTFDTANKEIFGGSGLISKSGIPKIGYYAYLFLSKLSNLVVHQSEDLLITKDEPNRIQLLCFSYSHLNSTYYYDFNSVFTRRNAAALFASASVQKKQILLKDLKEEESRYRIKSYRIGQQAGNILEEINQAASSDRLDDELVTYLKHRCQPQLEVKEELSRNHQLKIDLEISPQDIQLIEIQKVSR